METSFVNVSNNQITPIFFDTQTNVTNRLASIRSDRPDWLRFGENTYCSLSDDHTVLALSDNGCTV